MKNLLRLLPLLLFVFAISTFVACEEDEPIGNDLSILRLDGDNASGPVRAAGTHRFAVRFSESRLAEYDGLNLTGVRIFVGQSPFRLEISAHEGGEILPGGTGERRLVASGVVPDGGFFDYTFDSPLSIDASQSLWLVAEVELAEDQQSIGCDANGSGVDGGDWLFSPGTGWGTFLDETGESVNWNIRGIIE
ncbi:MAG: hypothetical protein AB8F78_07935 [Saprospiraceae bacterium]